MRYNQIKSIVWVSLLKIYYRYYSGSLSMYTSTYLSMYLSTGSVSSSIYLPIYLPIDLPTLPMTLAHPETHTHSLSSQKITVRAAARTLRSLMKWPRNTMG